MRGRFLNWEGCKNVRDLGGLRTGDSRQTCWRAVVRSDTPARLSQAGWATLYTYGIRTIITLRTDGLEEDELDFKAPYPDIASVSLAIEDITDTEFVARWVDSGLWCTPLYYYDALRRWPQRHAAVISAIGQAGPGGVLFHCMRGNDRTGIIALLLLALVGIKPEDILADYAISVDPERDEMLKRRGSSIREALLGALEGLEIEDYLRLGGAVQVDLDAVHRRLLG